MRNLPEFVFRFEAWQQKHKRRLVAFLVFGTLLLSAARLFRPAPFISEIAETIFTLGLWIWFISVVLGLMIFVTPLFSSYFRRRQNGMGREQAMMFEAKHPLTGSVTMDAVIFASVFLLGAVGIVFACLY